MKKLILIALVSVVYVSAFGRKNDSSNELSRGVTSYHENGELKHQGFYNAGIKNGEWKEWDEQGRLIGTSKYLNGMKHGVWRVFDQDGNKRMEMKFKNNEKTGTWSWWDESGKVVRTEKF